MNRRGIIVSGGSIQDAFALQVFEEVKPKYVIGVDGGLDFLYRNEIMPTYILGDFDSVTPHVIEYYKTKTAVPIRQLHPVKDATDTEEAVLLALELGVEELWILGATGTRLDHVMANIQILKIALDHGVRAWIIDSCNRISIWKEEIRLSKEEKFGTYFSLFPFGDEVKNVTIKGAKYPLDNYHMTNDKSRCVSNEQIGQETTILFEDGIVVLMETRD